MFRAESYSNIKDHVIYRILFQVAKDIKFLYFPCFNVIPVTCIKINSISSLSQNMLDCQKLIRTNIKIKNQTNYVVRNYVCD